MQLHVGQLEEHLAKRQESAVTAKLGEFSVSDDAAEMIVTSGVDKTTFTLDEQANNALSKYLKIPQSYFTKLDPAFRATLLRYEFERNTDVHTVVESLDGDVVAMHQPSQVMVPLTKVINVVTKTFKPDDTVRRLISSGSLLHVDVTTNDHKLVVPTDEQHDLAQAFVVPSAFVTSPEVGDVTEAGIRFLAHPFKSTAPSVNLYAERLVCLNGQVTDERLGQISLKGRTVDEVIAEMELAAEQLLGQLDGYMDKLSATRQMYPPGSPQAFVAQLAREANVSRKVLDAVLDIINQLPTPVSVWDCNQAFTSVANQMQYSSMVKLQTLGGDLAFDAQSMIERCNTCERKL